LSPVDIVNGPDAYRYQPAVQPWAPARAVPGAPNVVVIVLDDTGFGQLGSFGSDIATPSMDRLAREGLRYNRFHVTALCSPTRASVLTGRNHHAMGVGFLVDMPLGYPGYCARIPKSAAPLPRVLRDAGYTTLAVGKWHLVPRGERSQAGPFDRWPLGFGFERYYGFLHGDANHWAPNLVSDNHFIDPPATPEQGYHLTEDLADQSIRMVLDQQHSAQDKPFFLYWALGAMHAPHHVAQEWVEPYKGRFDDGWDRLRERVFARQVADGVVPADTVLTERPPWVASWDSLPEGERRMHARAQEVFAGFLTHTDAQIGRFLSFLDQIGQSENTIVVLLSDNGASAEGGRHGSVNEHHFSARLPETVQDNLGAYGEWGGPRSYSHYSWAWAWAGNTPLRLWKRYTWLGGSRTPLIVRWPRGISAGGEIRDQFCHAVDLAPTLLDACGITRPAVIDGVQQDPFDGASLTVTFNDSRAPAPRSTQYFEMLGSRSIIHDGWKATTDHVSKGVVDEEQFMLGSRDFATDHWSLFRLDDYSEAVDLSAQHPEIVRSLEQVWLIEASRNHVFPLGESLTDRLGALMRPAYPPGLRRTFYAGAPVNDENLPYLAAGFSIRVHTDIPDGPAAGMLGALGDWNGGFALYVKDSRLAFCFCPAGHSVTVTSPEPLTAGGHVLGVTCRPGPGGTVLTLTCDGKGIGEVTAAVAIPNVFQHGGTHLTIGYDDRLPVSDDYQPPFRWASPIDRVDVEGSPPPRPSGSTVTDAMRTD
jgi:arylsulfatase A-like enzyme